MKLTLILDGQEKVFENKKITFGLFLRATEIMTERIKEEFFGDNYPPEQMQEAKELVCTYFGCTEKEFEKGFMMEDSSDFFVMFDTVLSNIQLNNGKREVPEEDEGKQQIQQTR